MSRDGKTFLCCGYGLPSSTCDCNGCKWERDELPQYPTLNEAIKDRSLRLEDIDPREAETVHKMWLCETEMVVMRPGLYEISVREGCARCEEMERIGDPSR